MDSSNAEKAWENFADANPQRGYRGTEYTAFMAGWASRDAEVAELTAKNERLRERWSKDHTKGAAFHTRALNAEGDRDEALQALAESRARFGDSEARRAELEAVIEKVREWAKSAADYSDDTESQQIQAILAASPSVVLEDRDREVAARALEDAADPISDEFEDWEITIEGLRRWLRERAAAIRKGDNA